MTPMARLGTARPMLAISLTNASLDNTPATLTPRKPSNHASNSYMHTLHSPDKQQTVTYRSKTIIGWETEV